MSLNLAHKKDLIQTVNNWSMFLVKSAQSGQEIRNIIHCTNGVLMDITRGVIDVFSPSVLEERLERYNKGCPLSQEVLAAIPKESET